MLRVGNSRTHYDILNALPNQRLNLLLQIVSSLTSIWHSDENQIGKIKTRTTTISSINAFPRGPKCMQITLIDS